MRQLKREVKIGNVTIGGKNPIAVQTMLNVPVEDIEGNVAQAKRCEAAGCQILRVTCPSAADAKCIEAVKNAVNIPIVADIHFDYKAALACADVGVDKIRINPGNIGDDDRVKAVVQACQQKNIPIRIGVNGGSLEKHILAKYGAPVPEAMVESAMYHVRLLQKYDFDNIVISIKSSNVPRMMAAYRLLASQTDYPLHVGVTEAGGNRMGLIKSGMGIGGLHVVGNEQGSAGTPLPDGVMIPVNSIEKAPSAELRPGQKDSDSLPEYALLDQVLAMYIEHAHGRADLLADGFDEATVDTVMRLVDRAEWKRRQYPLGPKVTALAFGRDRRLPVTNAFRE